MKNRNLVRNDNWATPKEFFDKLNAEFAFDFDPCPLNENEITPDKNGLLIEWGQRNFINPPYSKNLKEAFVMKAIKESKKGKLCVMLLPVSTSTKLFHEVIQPNANEIRFVKSRIKFIGVNTKGELVNDKTPMHDSMIVVFGCNGKKSLQRNKKEKSMKNETRLEPGTEVLHKDHVNHNGYIGVAQNITEKYFVSTAMWATSIPATGMEHPTYETFIWEWDAKEKKRGKLIKQYYFKERNAAIKFHFRFCRTLAWRQLKQKMPNDNPYFVKDKV